MDDYVERVKEVVRIGIEEIVVERRDERRRADDLGSIVVPGYGELFLYGNKRWAEGKIWERDDIERLKAEVAFYKILHDRDFDIPYFTALVEFPRDSYGTIFSGLVTEKLDRGSIELIDVRVSIGEIASWLGILETFKRVDEVDISKFDKNDLRDAKRIQFCETNNRLLGLFDVKPFGYNEVSGMLYILEEGEKQRVVVGDGEIYLHNLKQDIRKEVEETIKQIDDSWVMR